MYTIGQLSKKTGVTTRTLDYYNEINLLNPSSVTEGGHRLYDEEDIMQLEQILALKYMGFSLQKIREILDEQKITWESAFDQQLEMVRQEKKRLLALEQSLNAVLGSIRVEGEIKWPIIFDIIQFFRKDPQAIVHLYEKYFSEKELEMIQQMNERISEREIQEWLAIIQDIRANLNASPVSQTSQDLTERWMNQVTKFFGSDEVLLEKVWSAISEHQDDVAFYPMDRDIVNFIEKVLSSRSGSEEK